MVELGDGDGGDLAEQPGILPSAKSSKRAFLASISAGVCSGRAERSRQPRENGVELLLHARSESRASSAALRAPCVSALLRLRKARGDVLVVAGQGGEGFVGHALVQFLAADKADDGVAALDVVVEEVERLAGDVGLEPEGDLAEFHGQRVEVDAVDAVADDVADRRAVGARRGLLLAGAHDGQLGGDAAGGGQQDVAGAAGDVGDAQGEQSAVSGSRLLESLGDQMVEGVLDQRLDEFVRRCSASRWPRVRPPGRRRTRMRARRR